MCFKNKKEHVLRCIKLGMSLYKAMLIAECTEEEVSILEKDETFLKQVEQQYALEEYELLLSHNTALEIARDRGQAGAIQWKLGKINPEKWNNNKESEVPWNVGSIEVNLIGKDNDND